MARRSEGIAARRLEDRDLKRELVHLHETRSEAFFGGSRSAFQRHVERTEELENEYARRHPEDVQADPARTRAGARLRAGQRVDGAGVGREVRRSAARRRDRTDRSGKRAQGKTTGRGRPGVPGLPGSYGRKGGTPQRGAGKDTGAAHRRYGKSISSKARPQRRGGRRPNSGMQG